MTEAAMYTMAFASTECVCVANHANQQRLCSVDKFETWNIKCERLLQHSAFFSYKNETFKVRLEMYLRREAGKYVGVRSENVCMTNSF
jgi:hypothetical protein